MFTSNAFARFREACPPLHAVVRGLMILAVIAGTLLDVVHKGSATYFFANWRKTGARCPGRRARSPSRPSWWTSSPRANSATRAPHRHLLTMYGFILYLVTTILMVTSTDGRDAHAGPGGEVWWLGG